MVLDVTDPAFGRRGRDTIEARHGRLDVLVNNAAVAVPGHGLRPAPGLRRRRRLRAIFETNFFGVVTVTNALLPLLRRSAAPRIVNVSSSGASLTRNADPDAQLPISAGYTPSKTALTALTLQYARELRDEGILVNAVCPGYCATDLNDRSGFRTPAQGAVAAVRMATIPKDGPTGTFVDEDGPVPW